MSTTATVVTSPELTQQVLGVIGRAALPLTFFQIQRHLPRPYQRRTDELRQVLQELTASGRLFPFPPYRSKAPRYWTRDPEQFARLVVADALNEEPCTQRELFLKVRRRLQGLPDGRLRELLTQMIAAGQLRKLPPRRGGRSNLLCAREARPRDYLAPVFRGLFGTLREMYRRLETEGVRREAFLHEAEALWRAMPWDRLSDEPLPPQAESPPAPDVPPPAPETQP